MSLCAPPFVMKNRAECGVPNSGPGVTVSDQRNRQAQRAHAPAHRLRQTMRVPDTSLSTVDARLPVIFVFWIITLLPAERNSPPPAPAPSGRRTPPPRGKRCPVTR